MFSDRIQWYWNVFEAVAARAAAATFMTLQFHSFAFFMRFFLRTNEWLNRIVLWDFFFIVIGIKWSSVEKHGDILLDSRNSSLVVN